MAIHMLLRLPWWFSGKKKKKKTNLPANARDADSIRGLGRPRGEGNGNPLITWEIPWTEDPTDRQSME